MSLEGGAFDLDIAASSLSADGGDNQLMIRLLAKRLAPALGERMRIERAGGLLRKSNTIRRVEVRIGDRDLTADLSGAAPSFTIGRLSGNICIRTDKTDARGWMRALLESLQKEAADSSTARLALESIVIGGGEQ